MTSANTLKTPLRRRTFLGTVLGTGLAATLAMTGLACAPNAFADPVDLQVVDRNTGQVLRIWRHHGRLFVAGRPGARYSLRVTNHTDDRVLVVLSVDGVNILSGETANTNQRGYIFKAHESYDLAGWRKSDTEIAAFNFAPLTQSYAARTGRPGDVGVIGMAVFKERVAEPPPVVEDVEPPPPVDQPDWSEESHRGRSGAAGALAPPAAKALPPAPRSMAAPSMIAPSQRAAPSPSIAQDQRAESAFARPRDEKLGTAHGRREWSVITIEPFERATSYPQFTRQIEYDTYANLVAAGVIHPPVYPEHHPRPFPSSPDGEGYVPDPPD